MDSYIYGYARVSTKQQDLIRQIDILQNYNYTEILTKKMISKVINQSLAN